MMTDASFGPSSSAPSPLRVAFVAGVTPGKWLRIWKERVRGIPLEATQVSDLDQLSVLHEGHADLSFVRLPVDREGLSLIPLYRETPVVVVPRDHVVSAFDEVAVADLADEHLLQDPDTVPEWRDVAVEVHDGTRVDVPAWTPEEAIAVVATGVGIVIVPKSVARLYDRKDVTHRPVTAVAESQIGLAWLTDATDARIEEFIGIVRGRTARSSRAGDAPREQKPKPKQTAARKPVPKSAGSSGRRGGTGGRRGRR